MPKEGEDRFNGAAKILTLYARSHKTVRVHINAHAYAGGEILLV